MPFGERVYFIAVDIRKCSLVYIIIDYSYMCSVLQSVVSISRDVVKKMAIVDATFIDKDKDIVSHKTLLRFDLQPDPYVYYIRSMLVELYSVGCALCDSSICWA